MDGSTPTTTSAKQLPAQLEFLLAALDDIRLAAAPEGEPELDSGDLSPLNDVVELRCRLCATRTVSITAVHWSQTGRSHPSLVCSYYPGRPGDVADLGPQALARPVVYSFAEALRACIAHLATHAADHLAALPAALSTSPHDRFA